MIALSQAKVGLEWMLGSTLFIRTSSQSLRAETKWQRSRAKAWVEGLEMRLSCQSWPSSTRSCAWFPAPRKQGVGTHTCDLSSQQVRTGGSGGQGHFWLCGKIEVCLGYITAYLKNKKGLSSTDSRMEKTPEPSGGTEGSGGLIWHRRKLGFLCLIGSLVNLSHLQQINDHCSDVPLSLTVLKFESGFIAESYQPLTPLHCKDKVLWQAWLPQPPGNMS